MLQWLLSVLSTPVFNTIVDAYKAKLAAANAQDELAVDLAVKEIEGEIAAARKPPRSTSRSRGAGGPR